MEYTRFGCNNTHCVYYSPFEKNVRYCADCINCDWDSEIDA